ncbi:hypothetical protein I0C86_27820 [Plantactinospora sp. S1510]|uniref:Uncharacterized protein n=1 Tax=Plantactinospora alkalitolerans TaxID=2789879 RepID=A0ABS0H2P2_9ACTN|nr:hypothetical protein [Plantactinospora alkalitolerans]MBF9132735.1 hypothetical protein [Plantactinospora alkalitolerans]
MLDELTFIRRIAHSIAEFVHRCGLADLRRPGTISLAPVTASVRGDG